MWTRLRQYSNEELDFPSFNMKIIMEIAAKARITVRHPKWPMPVMACYTGFVDDKPSLMIGDHLERLSYTDFATIDLFCHEVFAMFGIQYRAADLEPNTLMLYG